MEFDFAEWGKLQMALAGGSQHMNVLAADPNGDAMGSGGSALTPVAVVANSTAQEIVLGAGAVDAFALGDMVAVDVDYAQQTGYVGTGIPAAYVNDPLDVLRDRDYVRRVTFNVGSVSQEDGDLTDPGTTFAGWSSAGRIVSAEGDCVRRSRRRQLLSAMVCAIRRRARVGWANLLSLSAAEDGGAGERRIGRGTEAFRIRDVARDVRGAGDYGYQRQRTRGLLPQLLPGGKRSDLLKTVSPQRTRRAQSHEGLHATSCRVLFGSQKTRR